MTISCDDDILEKCLNHELARCLVVLGVPDVVNYDCDVSNWYIRVDGDVEGPCFDGPSGRLGKGSSPDCIAHSSSSVESVGAELKGECDGDLGIRTDFCVSSK